MPNADQIARIRGKYPFLEKLTVPAGRPAVTGAAIACNDGTGCTTGACDATSGSCGFVATNEGGACDDGGQHARLYLARLEDLTRPR